KYRSGINANCSPSTKRLLGSKLPLQALPAFEIILLELGRLHRVAREAHRKARLEHERHGVADPLWLELGLARALPGFRVGSVRRHAVVQTRAARQEALRLGVVRAMNEPHELAH